MLPLRYAILDNLQHTFYALVFRAFRLLNVKGTLDVIFQSAVALDLMHLPCVRLYSLYLSSLNEPS